MKKGGEMKHLYACKRFPQEEGISLSALFNRKEGNPGTLTKEKKGRVLKGCN